MRARLLPLAVAALLATGCAAQSATPAGSSTTAPTVQSAAAPSGDQCAGTRYAQLVGCHLQVAGTLNRAIGQACTQYLAPACASTIERYQGELAAAQHDLSTVAVPAALTQANGSLLDAIRTDLTASGQALAAIGAHSASEFIGAISTHENAGSLLTRAWSQAASAAGA